MNFEIFTITNWDRRSIASRFTRFMQETTDLDRHPLVIVENGDGCDKDLQTDIEKTSKVSNFQYIHLLERHGLARVWNMCMLVAKTEWVVICNDDSIPTHLWTESLEQVINKTPHQMYLLCHPNGFSAFCLNKTFWNKHGGFNNEFPEGYYEDDDWFLRVAFQEHVRNRQQVMDNFIFSYFDNFKISLFHHMPIKTKTRGWNREKNKKIFDKYWVQVRPDTEGAIENKSGKWYIPKDVVYILQ